MDTRNEDFAYFRGVLLNTEADTLPLPDAEGQAGGAAEATLRRALPDGLAEGLAALAKKRRLDLTALYETAAMLLLAKFGGSTEALCAPVRAGERRPVYFDFAKAASFAACCRTVKKQTDAAAKRSIDFAALCTELALPAMPVLTDDKAFFDGFALAAAPGTALCLLLDAKAGAVAAKYDAERYGEATMGRLLDSLTVLLQNAAQGEDDPGALDMLSDAQRAELDAFNDNDAPYDANETLIDRIDRAAQRFPDHTAVVYQNKRYTYRQFAGLTDRIAAYLHGKGLGRGDVVSILIPRCEYMPICAVGVLKTGAAYQPLDPSYPPERLQFMMQDAGAKLLIVDKALLSLVPGYSGPVLTLDEIPGLPAGTAHKKDLPRPKPEDLFILLYTSGSTGTPKGVMLEHGNLAAFCSWFTRHYQMDENSRAAAYASFGFDACMMDMYPTLCCGAQLHIIAEDIRLDLLAINRYFSENQITHAFMTTQVGRQYAEFFPESEYPRWLSVGGETLVPIQPPRFQLTNGYGPTECTIFTTTFAVDRLYRNVPIGKALDNVKLYIVDAHGRRVPVGVPGELCIAGPQVARGYLNRPEQTAKAFVQNPFSDDARLARLYRSGDIVRFLPDGNVEFIGRRDSQVKIRGFRIELSEVEGVIRQFEGIKDATVVAYDEAGGGKYVAAYVVADAPVDVAALNDFILKTKPPYMVPAVTMQLERIPLNQNMKVDKRALPKPEHKAETFAPPATDVQKKICELLAGVVGHSDFGADTDFFAAGLTSVGSIKFLVQLTEAFGAAVTSRALHEYGTAQKLEDYLRTAPKAAAPAARRDCYPLTQTQLGIYVECMKHPEATFYNLPCYFPLDKNTDVDRLCAAVRSVIDAHPAVKCAVRADAEDRVCMFPQKDRPVEIDIVQGAPADFEAFFKGFAKPFDLAQGPLYRFAVFVSPEQVWLVFDFHHILCDGSSIAVFAQELDRALRGEALLGEPYSQLDLAADEEQARGRSVSKGQRLL